MIQSLEYTAFAFSALFSCTLNTTFLLKDMRKFEASAIAPVINTSRDKNMPNKQRIIMLVGAKEVGC